MYSLLCLHYMILYIQMELITQQSMKAGFTGGVVIDYPNSAKAKKLVSYVCSILYCFLQNILVFIYCWGYC